MTELWLSATNNTKPDIYRHAELAASAGCDGIFMTDSQNIRMECWVALTAVALSTNLQVGTFVTNPLTRHVAVTAGAAATLQEVSGGRVVLGVGRGDSGLAYLGYGPASFATFETFLLRLQAYLRGEGQPFVEGEFNGAAPLSESGYKTVPEDSRIVWLPSDQPKVPVNVVASGRRVLKLGAVLGDEVTPVVGADIGVLGETIAELRATRAAAGGDPSTLRISLRPPIAIDADITEARRRITPMLGEQGRAMSLQGGQPTSLDPSARAEFAATIENYDMTRHGPTGTVDTPAITNRLSDEVIDRHGIVGDADHVYNRLVQLLDLGADRLILPAADHVVVHEVLPELRKLLPKASPKA